VDAPDSSTFVVFLMTYRASAMLHHGLNSLLSHFLSFGYR
jgi:hypothetical protein